MSQPTTSRAVERLREATRDEHERTDRAVERRFFGSGEMGRSDYVDLLAAFLGLYRPLEEELARTDDLTGLANRREVQRRLQAEVEPARRYGSSLSAVILDLDHFKAVNDRHGHQAGDQLLRRVGRLFQEEVRASDVVGRCGGEEFALLVPETGREEAAELAVRILEGLRGLSIEVDGETIEITGGAGVATLLDPEESPDELMHRADDALYRAKEEGRDRVVAD